MDSINIIESACHEIVRAGLGALIVIEGAQKLDDVIASGVVIDEPLEERLLVDIFDDSSPLHDGAVVVRNERIIAAGCALPIVPRATVNRLGLRHKAAIELGGMSDATIYVVSQQRGTIAVVKDKDLVYIKE